MEPIDPNHLRRLAGLPLNESVQYEHLEESVADNEAINRVIDKELAGLSFEEQSKYIDALEVLKNAGPTGLDGRAWVAAYRQVRDTPGAEPEADASKVVSAAARMFYELIIGKKDGAYYWDEEIGNENVAYPEAAVDQPMHDAVAGHVGLTYELMSYAREMGEVSVRSLSRLIMNKTGMVDPTVCQQLALNFLDAQRGNFTSTGDGNYTFHDPDARKPRGTTNYSDMFKGFAANANKADLGDD